MPFTRAIFLASILILSSCEVSPATSFPEKLKPSEVSPVKDKDSKILPGVKIQVETEMVSRKAKIIASNSEGVEVCAKNNYDHTWSVEGDNSVGGIIHVDPVTKIIKYQSSSMSTPIQSMIVNPDQSVETVEFNAFGSKKTIVIDSLKNVIQVEIRNSPKNVLIAKKSTNGIWSISGSDETGKSINGTLEVDEETGFILYKGSNGSFMYKESMPIDSLIAAMSLIKVEITEKDIEKELQNISHRRSELTNQVQDILYAIISEIQRP